MTLNIYAQHMDFIACQIVPMSQGQCEGLKTQDVKAEQSPPSLELTPFIFIFFRNQDSKESVLNYNHVHDTSYIYYSHTRDNSHLCIL